MPMILIAGLGNPGAQYYKNRHNVGFQFIDYIAKKFGEVEFITKKRKSDFLTIDYNKNKKVALVKPLTFMNNSGEAVLFMAAFLKVKDEDILVCYDDLDLEFGDIKIKNSGTDAGHNGIKSVRALLKRDNFTRMRIGIGRPKDQDGNPVYEREKIIDYVLSDFTLVEEFLLENIVFKYGFEVVKAFIEGGFVLAQKELARVKPIIHDELSKEPTLPEFD